VRVRGSHLEVARTRHYLAKVLGLAGRYKEAIQVTHDTHNTHTHDTHTHDTRR
jgi:hypothetical protein